MRSLVVDFPFTSAPCLIPTIASPNPCSSRYMYLTFGDAFVVETVNKEHKPQSFEDDCNRSAKSLSIPGVKTLTAQFRSLVCLEWVCKLNK